MSAIDGKHLYCTRITLIVFHAFQVQLGLRPQTPISLNSRRHWAGLLQLCSILKTSLLLSLHPSCFLLCLLISAEAAEAPLPFFTHLCRHKMGPPAPPQGQPYWPLLGWTLTYGLYRGAGSTLGWAEDKGQPVGLGVHRA